MEVVERAQSSAAGRRTAATASRADWAFCRDRLAEVSRTFVRPIDMLPGRLRTAVTCGYLLCRIVDTIEDHPNLPLDERDALYRVFLDVVEGRAEPEAFADAWAAVEHHGAEHQLCLGLPRVMRVFRTLPESMHTAILPWVSEMTRGMSLYSHRPPGADGLQALYSAEDLFRYCYFVAGTVGNMLTELFLAELPDIEPERARTLRLHAEAFGVGLQLVNVLKDVTDDRARRVSFVPRTLCEASGIGVASLTDPAHRAAAHAAVAPLFDAARARLDQALEYVLAVPASSSEVRLFCLLPLWMAVRTLALARGNDAMFEPGVPVKISRGDVAKSIAECVRICRRDDAIRERYARLWEEAAQRPA